MDGFRLGSGPEAFPLPFVLLAPMPEASPLACLISAPQSTNQPDCVLSVVEAQVLLLGTRWPHV